MKVIEIGFRIRDGSSLEAAIEHITGVWREIEAANPGRPIKGWGAFRAVQPKEPKAKR